MGLGAVIIVMIVFFICLVVVLHRVMSRQVSSATSHLQDLSQDYMRKQEELKERLQETDKHYQQQLATAKEDIEKMRAQAKQETDSARQSMMEQARKDSERIVQQAIESRDAMRKEMEHQSAQRVLESAAALLQAALPEALLKNIHLQCIEELCNGGLGAIANLQSREAISEAVVRTSQPLSEQQQKRLRDQLQRAVGRPLELMEVQDVRLIAGVVVTVGHLVLDGSLASKLEKAYRDAKHTAE